MSSHPTAPDRFATLDGLLARLAPLAAHTLPDGEARVRAQQHALTSQRTRIMLYGAYNAGKSSLINCLLGADDQATEGEIPTTDRVNTFEWGAHLLLDTPGVNAPIEHEAVTLEALRTAHLVLFVVREGDQDVADVYQRLFALLAERRPVFIVLNHEHSEGQGSEAIETVHARLRTLLLEQAGQYGIDDAQLANVPVLPLNIKLAHRGNTLGKPLLTAHSGYTGFIDRFQRWLDASASAHGRLEIAARAVERELIEPLREHLQAGTDHAQRGQLDARIQEIAHQHHTLRLMAGNRIRSAVDGLRPRIGEALDQSGGDADTLNAALMRMTQAEGAALSQWLEGVAGEAAERAARALDTLRHARCAASAPEHDGPGLSAALGKTIESATLGGLRRVDKEHVSWLLQLGRKLKLPLLKGRWSKTLEAWAGKAVPWLHAASIAIEAGLAVREQSQHNQRERSLALQRAHWIDDIATDIQSRLLEGAEEAIEQIHAHCVAPVLHEREALLQAASACEHDRQQLESLAAQLRALVDVRPDSPAGTGLAHAA